MTARKQKPVLGRNTDLFCRVCKTGRVQVAGVVGPNNALGAFEIHFRCQSCKKDSVLTVFETGSQTSLIWVSCKETGYSSFLDESKPFPDYYRSSPDSRVFS